MSYETDYEWLTRMNLCHKCRKEKPAPGKKYCFRCLDIIRMDNTKRYDAQKASEYQKRRRELYRLKKKQGICVRCSSPATHGIYCYEHSIEAKRHSRKMSDKRKMIRYERGLIPDIRRKNNQCLWCGKPALEGMQCCKEHQEIFSSAGKKAYEANLKNRNNSWINELEAWKKKNNWKRSEII